MIKEYFLKFVHHWKILFQDKAYCASLIAGILLLIGGFVVLYYCGKYNDTFVYTSVGDLILDRIPTYDLEWLFLWGFYVC